MNLSIEGSNRYSPRAVSKSEYDSSDVSSATSGEYTITDSTLLDSQACSVVW